MTQLLLPLHLVAVGIWLGCVLTEVLFERALLGKGRDQELLLAGLHMRVDLTVEIPAFVVVLLTGLLMWQGAAPGALFYAKVAFGLLAIITNVYCVWLVYRRLAHARAGHWSAFEQVDHTQHKMGAAVLIGIVVALVLGLYLLTPPTEGDAEQVPVNAHARLRDGMRGANHSDTGRYREDLLRCRPSAAGMCASRGIYSALH